MQMSHMGVNYMKNKIIHNLKFILLGIIVALAASYVYARTQTDAPCPANDVEIRPCHSSTNSPVVITTGSDTNIKEGSLSVGTLVAEKAVQIDGKVTFQGFLRGVVAGGDVTVKGPTEVDFGTEGHGVGATITGNLSVGTTAGSASAANLVNNGGGNGTLQKICSDTNGKIILCTPSNIIDLCINDTDSDPNNDDPLYVGNQTTVPVGSWRNADGTCSHPIDVCPNLPGPQPSIPPGYELQNDGTCAYVIHATATVGVDWASGYQADGPHKYFWAPLKVDIQLSKAAPVPVNFDWGYCQTRNSRSIAYDFHDYCIGFDLKHDFNLPYPDFSTGTKAYGEGSVQTGGTSFSALLYSENTGDFQPFDNNGNLATSYFNFPVQKVILYNVSLPSGYLLDLQPVSGSGPAVELHYK